MTGLLLSILAIPGMIAGGHQWEFIENLLSLREPKYRIMLGNFTFHNPTKLIFGEDSLNKTKRGTQKLWSEGHAGLRRRQYKAIRHLRPRHG